MAADARSFTDDLRGRLRAVLGARPWLVGSDRVDGAVGVATGMLEAGAERVAAVGVLGGAAPAAEGVTVIDLDAPFDGPMMEGLRHADRVLHDPPVEVLDAVDAWDRERRAMAVVDYTMSAGTVCGRPTYGARPRAWAELEDKLVVGELWRGAGIDAGPSIEVDLDDLAACRAAHRLVAGPRGSVFAGDNAGGFHGGATSTRWAADESRVELVVRALGAGHRRARVMPFVEGVPCSVHGVVLEHTTVALRPVEMLVYRAPGTGRFVYGKAASHWDPPAPDREAMRSMARSVGDELRRRVAYRGVFTLDGVMGASGFVPTEVNPRMGGALPVATATPAGDHIDLYLVNLALVAGDLEGLDPVAFESWVVGDLDRRRRGVALFETPEPPRERLVMSIVRDGTGALVAMDEPPEARSSTDPEGAATALATVEVAEHMGHGLMRIALGPGIEVGPSVAPLALELSRVADRAWGLGLDVLEPAADVRR